MIGLASAANTFLFLPPTPTTNRGFFPTQPAYSRFDVNLQGYGSSFLKYKQTSLKRYCSLTKSKDDLVDDEACELVNGAEVFIDGVRAFLFQAVKNNNGTGIIFLSDIFGLENSATRDFAYRVACNGYNVLLPDLFRGDQWTEDRPMAEFEEWRAQLDLQRVASDIFKSVRWMANEFEAAGLSKKLGVIGFCFGGGQVVDILAQDQGAHFCTGVSFYGTRIDTNAAGNIKVPLLLVAGDKDPLCPVSVLRDIKKAVDGSSIVIFKDRGHGFAHRPQSPDEDTDAEKAFTIMRNWLHEKLVAIPSNLSQSQQ